jgi:hypothetical protein
MQQFGITKSFNVKHRVLVQSSEAAKMILRCVMVSCSRSSARKNNVLKLTNTVVPALPRGRDWSC